MRLARRAPGDERNYLMATSKEQAGLEFRRIVKWIALAAVLMVAGALAYLRWMDAWTIHAIIATILGVFVSVVLGCGLFALAFFSDKSGHDDDVGGATSRREDR
jgi:hypothetical protein